MAVLLSPVGGAAAQFLDNNGNPLLAGKLYTYVAGTTTNQATYTSSSGVTPHTNPIILDAGGRVPGGEIWLTDGLQYKFVLKNANDVLIGTYDNLVGINSNFVNFLTETEVQTATAGQTVFTLTTMQYQPGTNNLSVFVDGVNQIDGATYSYVETSSTVVTFTAGLHVGALVKFTTAQTLSTGVTDASLVTYTPPFAGSVATNVEAKLAQYVSVEDFGAVGDGITDDSGAIQAALDTGLNVCITADKTFAIQTGLTMTADGQVIYLAGTLLVDAAMTAAITSTDHNNVKVIGAGVIDANSLADNGVKFIATAADPYGVSCEGFTFKNTPGPVAAAKGGIYVVSSGGKASAFRHKNVSVKNVKAKDCGDLGVLIAYCDGVTVEGCVFDTCAFHGHESVNCSDVLIDGNTAQDCGVSGVGVGDETINWVISNNVIRNCAGDGSITCEFNSVFGTIVGNTIIDANTQGINISYGATGVGPFEKMQGIVCTNNVMRCKSGVIDKIGINYYSSTGAGIGDGVVISDNVIDGFNWGIAYQYSNNGSIVGNTIMNLVGTASKAIVAQMCVGVNIEANTCNTNTGDHAIQILSYAGTDSTLCNVNNNFVQGSGSGAKALVYVDGTGNHNVSGNRTTGALNFVLTNAAATVNVAENYGNIAAAAYAGAGTFHSTIGTAFSSTVGAAGAASALPATPLGYATCFVVGVGQVKIPYYNL